MKAIKFFLFAAIAFSLLAPGAFATTTIHAPAVDTNGKGILTELEASVVKGTGEIFVDIEPFISVDTQQGAKTAAQIAADEAKVNLDKYNVLFRILAQTQIVDGPSGGAAMALLAYSEFKQTKPRSDLVITGSIERDGSVGTVGGVYEKALSLKGTKMKLFLVPKGQAVYQGKNVALEAEKIGVQVVEVKNFQDVVKYAFTPEGSKVEAKVFVEQPLVLKGITPSTQLEPLKQIAAEEIAGLEKTLRGLEKEKDTEIIRASVNKSVYEAKYLLQQGYYYSAANVVFVSKIAVGAYKMNELERAEFMKMTQLLQDEAEKVEFTSLTVENMEWIIGAKLRYYWALNKIKGIKKTIGATNDDDLHTEYVAAKNWVDAAKRMNEIARGAGGNTQAKQDSLKEISEKLIAALNESQGFVLDSEIEQHYLGAVAAFEDSDYATAFFDALFAKSLTESAQELETRTGSEFTRDIKTEKNLLQYNESLWAQYYFIHSLYTYAQDNRTNEFVYLANTLKLQHLSDLLKENIPLMKESLANNTSLVISYPGGNEEKGLTVETKISAQSTTDWILLGVLLLLVVVLLGILLRMLTRRQAAPLSGVEKIEKLDELLMQGKISERNWEVLHERYFKQLKAEKGSKAKQKPRKKK